MQAKQQTSSLKNVYCFVTCFNSKIYAFLFSFLTTSCLPFSILCEKRWQLGCSRQKRECFSCFHCSVLYILSEVSLIAKGMYLEAVTTLQPFLLSSTSELSNKRFEITVWERIWKPYRGADATALYIPTVNCATHGQL